MERCSGQLLMTAALLLAGPVFADDMAKVLATPVTTTIPSPTYVAPDSRAGDAEPDLAEKIPAKVFAAGENQFFTFNGENDSLTSHSDRHYTNGVRLSYLDLRQKPPSFTRALDKWIPFFEITDQTAVSYSVGQNIYTPDDIKVTNPGPGQRPYAGFLYGSVGLDTLVDNHVDSLNVTLGVVGPAAGGELVQKTWHRFVGAERPQGWDHQLKNEPIVGVAWDRSWPEWMVLDSGDWFVSATPDVGATVGNAYTFANTGFNVRFGPSDARWQSTPERIPPAMPGSGFFAKPDEWFSWYLFTGVNGRAVARNIFLDGNTFSESAHVEKKNYVGDFNAGVAATFGRVRVTYTNVYRTKEYDGQKKGDIFGTLNVGYRF